MNLIQALKEFSNLAASFGLFLILNKFKTINHDCSEIITISSTQKMVMTSALNSEGNKIVIKKWFEPHQKLMGMYSALKYKSIPFRMKKIVVPKTE